MDSLDLLRHLYAHAAWADAQQRDAVVADPPSEAYREFAHVVGAAEVWLSRIMRRASRSAIWPQPSPEQLTALARDVYVGYDELLSRQTASSLDAIVSYVNSAGQSFDTPLGEILLHVALHGQYHRGKVNLLLRQASASPAPTDFIAFVRGVPAATTPVPSLRSPITGTGKGI